MRTTETERPTSTEGSSLGPLLLVLSIAAAYRVAAILFFPVVFDEVQVMAYGLARGLERGNPWALVFEVPIAVSNGITPLWYWVQALPAWLFGETSKLGLRTLPLLLGLAGVWLSYRVGGRLRGRRSAFLAGLLYATLSPLFVINARGEFAESLLAPLALLLLLDLLGPPGGGPIPLRAALWPALALLTYFGKALVIWGSYGAFLALLWLLGRLRSARPDPLGQPAPRLTIGKAAALIAVPLVPSLGWLGAAQMALFRGGAPVVTDLGPVASVWESIWNVTVGYGSGPTSFMVAGWREALFVYTDFAVWPSLSLLAVPCVATLFRLGRALGRGLSLAKEDETEQALMPLCLIVPTLAVLLAKGALDVRFHLLYLAMLLPYVAVSLDDWIRMLEAGRLLPFFLAGGLECVYVAWTRSWVDRQANVLSLRDWALTTGLGVALLLALVGLLRKTPLRARRGDATLTLVVAALVAGNVLEGPLLWGRRWAWEPSPLASDRPRHVSEFPNADLQLALCFVARQGVPAARPFLLRALDRHPDDPATIALAGETLLRLGDEEATLLVGRLNEYLRRHPEDQLARRTLEKALKRAQGR